MRHHYLIKINFKIILNELTITLVGENVEQFICHTFVFGV